MEFKAVDTETTGLSPWHGCQPFFVTSCDSKEFGCDYWHWAVDPLTRKVKLPRKQKQEVMKNLYKKNLVFHNCQFDIRMLETKGIDNTLGNGWDWSYVFDTSIACHLVNSALPKKLDFNVLYYLDYDVTQFERNCKLIVESARRLTKKHFPDWIRAGHENHNVPGGSSPWKSDMWLPAELKKVFDVGDEVPLAEEWDTFLEDYANTDSETTAHLFVKLKEIIEDRDLWDLYLQRMDLVRIVYQMENYGVTYSEERLSRQQKNYTEEAEEYKQICENIAKGYKYELEMPRSGNNKSLTDFIFDVMDLEPQALTAKGNPSLDSTSLKSWLGILPRKSKQRKFIESLKERRSRTTAISYMDGYSKYSFEENPGWMRLHPNVNPAGTHTLRMSSSNPNEQNISKREGFNLRYSFGPAPGREWWALDYNNLELRIPAYESGEPAMLELFEQPDKAPYYGSYHMLIASILYENSKWKECLDDAGEEGVAALFSKRYKTQYGWTKNGNFADLYGAVDKTDTKTGKVGTADAAYHIVGAQRMVSERLSEKAKLNKYYQKMARTKGYITTLYDEDFGKGFPLVPPKERLSTTALNYHVQGTACWVISRAMQKCDAYLKPYEDYHLIMNVHDELVFDFPYKPRMGNRGKVKKIAHLMASCGEVLKPRVKLTVGIDYHPNNWSEAVAL